MKKIKKLLSIILSFSLLFSLTTGFDFSAYSAMLSSSGSCGTNVKYSFNSSTGELTIYGTGSMTNYSSNTSPFYNQPSIKSVVIISGVTSIVDYAFYNCTGLTSVTIPGSVTSIGSHAFSSCEGLASINVNSSNKYYSSQDGVLYNKNKTTLIQCPIGNTRTSFTIPNSVTSIGSSAFSSCKGLTSITIPNSVTSIGSSAFSLCKNLTSITIPNSVTSIGSSAFIGCDYNLTSVTIGNSVTSIGSYAFSSCKGLASITIPNSVTSIGDYAFSSCKGLASIDVDSSNKYYSSQDGVLYNKDKTKLIQYPIGNTRTSFLIPDSVTSIGTDAFYNCTGLTSVTIPDSVTSIGISAFYNVNNIAYKGTASGSPWGAKSVNGYLDGYLVYKASNKKELLGCSSQATKNITIPNSVTSIGNSAFYDCTGLTSITMLNSVTSIGSYAFYKCTGLTSVTIGNSVTSIGSYAFSSCTGLTSITIPDSVTSIGTNAFYNCTGLARIDVDSSNKYYSSQDGVLYNKNKTTLIQCPIGNTRTSFTMPNSVTSIGSYAFYKCTGLTSVTIPNCVTSIGNDAFSHCTGLTSVTIPNSVTSIGDYAFSSCTGLTNLYYNGTQSQWSGVSKGSNTIPSGVKIFYHLEHSYSLIENVDSTCTTNGYNKYQCVCGDAYTEILNFEHSYELLDCIEVTCINDGLYIYECSICGEMYSVEVKAFGHKPNETVIENLIGPTCTDKGSYDEVTFCTVCEIELNRNTIITNELGHNVIIDKAVAVTCTTDGLTQGSHCSRCNEMLIKQEAIPALNHNYAITDSQAPACTVDGYNTYTCQNCNDSYTEVIDKTGHTNLLYRTTANCEKAGYDVYKCSVCSALTSVKVDALGHICSSFNGIVDNELSYTCSRCSKDYTMTASEVIEKWNQSVINASAKDFPELDVTNDGIINAKDYAKLKHIQSFGN